MLKYSMSAAMGIGLFAAFPAPAQTPATTSDASPPWVQRGAKGAGQAAMAPLVGSWRVELSIYGTMGRNPDWPPIVSKDLRATRSWIADGHYLEETIEGTVDGKPYWRRGWRGTAISTGASNGSPLRRWCR